MTDTEAPPRLGEVITTLEQVTALPIGSIICGLYNPSNNFTKQRENHWLSKYSGNTQVDTAFTNGEWRVTHNPEEPVTLEKWCAVFRDIALLGTSVHGISTQPVFDALHKMKLDLKLVPGNLLSNPYDKNEIPDGTVIHYAAGRPAVYVRENGGWKFLMGYKDAPRPAEVAYALMHIDAMPGVALPDREPTAKDAERIAKARASIWTNGQEFKSRHSWCGTYEMVIAAMKVDGTEPTPVVNSTVGREVGAAQCIALPEGTVLRHPGHLTLYIRDNTVINGAQVRVVASSEADPPSYGRTMTVVHDPDDGTPMSIPFGEVEPHLRYLFADRLPTSSQYNYSHTLYEKFEDNLWGRPGDGRGRHVASAFSDRNVHLVLTRIGAE